MIFAKLKLIIGGITGIAFSILLVLLKLKSVENNNLQKDLDIEKANGAKLESALDETNKQTELRNKADDIRENNAITNPDDVFNKLHKYQRD